MEKLRTDLSVIFAVGSWHVPELPGRDAPHDPRERDKRRREFAEWLVTRLRECGYEFVRHPPRARVGPES
jgi:hypothetical protein